MTGLVLATMLGACSRACAGVEFDSWQKADRILVAVYSQAPKRTIADPAVISQVVAFAKAHQEGWGIPIVGTPVAKLNIEFYGGKEFLGHLGIGKSFLETQGCDDFVSRSLSSKDRNSILQILGISELPE